MQFAQILFIYDSRSFLAPADASSHADSNFDHAIHKFPLSSCIRNARNKPNARKLLAVQEMRQTTKRMSSDRKQSEMFYDSVDTAKREWIPAPQH